jgi:hypothetical protein
MSELDVLNSKNKFNELKNQKEKVTKTINGIISLLKFFSLKKMD